ncbi:MULTISPECIES: ABC transporter [Microbacterium]|uniref:ABC transporter n=1 Tax=Microbacterium TaxID=33882 RepID=UPI000CFE7FD3|nr:MULTISPECIES: ABC transporter [unclassified Microbacterium]PRB63912.1 ABC transporter [Microbacterium sp. MYb45]
MSDPDAPQPEKPTDVDDVVGSANAGLDAAAAAGADVPGSADAPDHKPADAVDEKIVDPDLAAFEAAERDHPGTFASPPPAVTPAPIVESRETARDVRAEADAETESFYPEPIVGEPVPFGHEQSGLAGAAYAQYGDDTETRIVPSEPLIGATGVAAAAQPQPIFVQAPEPPRDRGNRGTAGLIGLLATLVFAVLYLGTALGLGAIAGEVNGENIGEAALAPLMTWGYWTPVVVFFLGFWLLGAIINRGRWGLWVVFGIIVGVIAYAGHILGQLFEAPFWKLTSSQGLDLVGEQLLAPLAIAAFVFARELTIWFGAWVSRSGARKTELNAEAQREYERTLEAGPTLSR